MARCSAFWRPSWGMASIGPAVDRLRLSTLRRSARAAQIQSARETWARLSTLDRFCVDRALARRNTNIEGLIQSGIGPDDGRLGSTFAECRRFTEPNLRRNVGCTTTDEHGGPSQPPATNPSRRATATTRSAPSNPGRRSSSTSRARGSSSPRSRPARRAKRGRPAPRRKGGPSSSRCSRPVSLRTSATRPRSCGLKPRGSRARIEQQLAARTGPSAPDTETINREVGGLGPLSQAEAVRLSALDRMSTLRAQAEARTRSDAPEGLKKRLADLRKEAVALSEPPRAIQPPKPAGRPAIWDRPSTASGPIPRCRP